MAGKREKTRKGISAVIFRMKGKEPEFLILHRIKRWTGWEMLKGGRIGREKPLNNLKRELREEIHAEESKIGAVIILPFKLSFKTPPEYVKKYKYTAMEFQSFLVEYNGKVSIKGNSVLEHDGYEWVSFEKAEKMLTHDSSKDLLRKAYKVILDIFS
ncbi:MAG: NUDIX domain-containing protein [Candidatus Micrarchaeota archaeon]|nr:NUDIX domain-containing protein [Candidatus Micrarchaeota archaeon]